MGITAGRPPCKCMNGQPGVQGRPGSKVNEMNTHTHTHTDTYTPFVLDFSSLTGPFSVCDPGRVIEVCQEIRVIQDEQETGYIKNGNKHLTRLCQSLCCVLEPTVGLLIRAGCVDLTTGGRRGPSLG